MNSLKKGIAMSAMISALAAGALAAHADAGGTQPTAAESRQYENFEQQLSMGSVASYSPSEHDDSAAGGAQAQAPRSGVFHRIAGSGPVRKLESALHGRPAGTPSVFDDPINTASPGG
jgi:hypothetical protein